MPAIDEGLVNEFMSEIGGDSPSDEHEGSVDAEDGEEESGEPEQKSADQGGEHDEEDVDDSSDEEDDGEEEGEDEEKEEKGKPQKKKSRWQRSKEALAAAKAEAEKVSVQLNARTQQFDELLKHTEYFSSQAEKLQAENARLKARLDEFGVKEYPNEYAERAAKAELELQELRRQSEYQTQLQQQQRAWQQQQRAQAVAAQVREAASQHGVQAQDVFRSMVLALQVGQQVTPAQVAAEIALRQGGLPGAAKQRRAAEHVPPSRKKPSTSKPGRPGIYRSSNDNLVDEMVNLLEALE